MNKVLSLFSVSLLTSIIFVGCQDLTTPTNSSSKTEELAYVVAKDHGVVLNFGKAKDGCDEYGAREASVIKDGDLYYLFYDGQSQTGWRTCLAISRDLINWERRGTVLNSGIGDDEKAATSPWFFRDDSSWQMFYLGVKNVTADKDQIPMFPYVTMKAEASSLFGPWKKNYDITPFRPKEGTYYSSTASPGHIIKENGQFLQFFSGSREDKNGKIYRTIGIARTDSLNSKWKIDDQPILPAESEQIENSSFYFETKSNTWYMFVNHIGQDEKGVEYADAIWVYWTKDLNQWSIKDKAQVIDGKTSKWAHGTIGMPSVIQVGEQLAILYDGVEGDGRGHMGRDIGLAFVELPIQIIR